MSRTYASLDANGVLAQKAVKKLAGQSIQITQTTIAHGLGVAPSVVIVMARGNALVWESADADSTNVYLTGAGITTVDIYVGV